MLIQLHWARFLARNGTKLTNLNFKMWLSQGNHTDFTSTTQKHEPKAAATKDKYFSSQVSPENHRPARLETTSTLNVRFGATNTKNHLVQLKKQTRKSDKRIIDAATIVDGPYQTRILVLQCTLAQTPPHLP